MPFRDDTYAPLALVESDKDYRKEMWIALEKGDSKNLQVAVSGLSVKDLDACHAFSFRDVPHIPTADLPSAVREDLQDQDEIEFSPIHYATSMGARHCLEILLKAGANPNIKDTLGQTPLHILPGYRSKIYGSDYSGCLDLLLSQKQIDANRLDLSKATPLFRARQHQWPYMITKLKELGIHDSLPNRILPRVQKTKTQFADALLKDLLDENLEGFRNTLDSLRNLNADTEFIINENHGGYTLLQYACRCEMYSFIEELLKHGASATKNYDTNYLPPVLWITKFGYFKVLRSIMKHMAAEGDLENDALRVCCKTMETPLHMSVICTNTNNNVGYYQCLQILLEHKEFLDIDAINDDGNTALHFAALCHDLRALCDLLKNGANFLIKNVVGLNAFHYVKKEGMMTILDNCIEFNRKEKMIDKDFWITLNYNMMDDDRYFSSTHSDSSKCSDSAEMNFLNLVAETFKDKDILHHPILSIFIDIKWQNVRRYFYFNFMTHFMFILLLVSYIIIYHSEQVIDDSIKGIEKESLGVSITFPDSAVDSDIVNENMINDSNDTDSYLRNILVMFIVMSLVCWQIMQLLMMNSWKVYLTDIKRMIEVTTIVLTGILLFSPFDDSVKMGLASWVILFSSLEFILQLGQLPQFAVYVTMFNTVAWNFFKFISLFSGVIFSFGLSFYLMFQPCNSMFNSFFNSLIKTIVMTTGELEYASLNISKSTLPGASQILIVSFVFLILLVLTNLLNGLALKDIQEIQRMAEVISRVSLIDRMTQLEKAFHCSNVHNPLKRILDYLFKLTLTFKYCLPKHQLTIYISRNPTEYANDNIPRKKVCECHSYSVSKRHITSLMHIVLGKRGSSSRH